MRSSIESNRKKKLISCQTISQDTTFDILPQIDASELISIDLSTKNSCRIFVKDLIKILAV